MIRVRIRWMLLLIVHFELLTIKQSRISTKTSSKSWMIIIFLKLTNHAFEMGNPPGNEADKEGMHKLKTDKMTFESNRSMGNRRRHVVHTELYERKTLTNLQDNWYGTIFLINHCCRYKETYLWTKNYSCLKIGHHL